MPEEQSNETKLNEVTTDSILEVIEEGAEVYSEITSNFIKNFTFYDKTLYGWASDLMVEIPNVKKLDTVEFRRIMLELAQNTQVANNYYSVSCSISDAITGGNSIKKSDVINAIVSNYQKKGAKRPAATVIESMAESYMSNTISARVASKMVKNFWKQRIDMLLEIRKIMEQIGMSLHVEMKWTGQ
jgi:ribosomal protein L14